MINFPFGIPEEEEEDQSLGGPLARSALVNPAGKIFKGCVAKYGEEWVKYIAGAVDAAKDFMVDTAGKVWKHTTDSAQALVGEVVEVSKQIADGLVEGFETVKNALKTLPKSLSLCSEVANDEINQV